MFGVWRVIVCDVLMYSFHFLVKLVLFLKKKNIQKFNQYGSEYKFYQKIFESNQTTSVSIELKYNEYLRPNF